LIRVAGGNSKANLNHIRSVKIRRNQWVIREGLQGCRFVGNIEPILRSKEKMDVFATKVMRGGGLCFDPMMKERGGRIVGETLRQKIEVAEAMLEVMAEAGRHILIDEINPVKLYIGEILP
jgi:hypothetical protein